jgi:hypothetical protein
MIPVGPNGPAKVPERGGDACRANAWCHRGARLPLPRRYGVPPVLAARRPAGRGALTTGHSAADVRAAFSCSYQTLTPESARLFRLLGMHAGPDISLEAAASLCALELGRTRRCLTELEISHLITQHAPGRYSFHDLLRAYATDLASACDSEPERGRALRRVWDFYAHTGHTADRLMDRHRFSVSLRPSKCAIVSARATTSPILSTASAIPMRPSAAASMLLRFGGRHLTFTSGKDAFRTLIVSINNSTR